MLGDRHILSGLLIKIQFARLVCGRTSFLTELIDPIMKNPTYASRALVGPVSPVGKLLWKMGSLACRFLTTCKCRMLQHTVDLYGFVMIFLPDHWFPSLNSSAGTIVVTRSPVLNDGDV